MIPSSTLKLNAPRFGTNADQIASHDLPSQNLRHKHSGPGRITVESIAHITAKHFAQCNCFSNLDYNLTKIAWRFFFQTKDQNPLCPSTNFQPAYYSQIPAPRNPHPLQRRLLQLPLKLKPPLLRSQCQCRTHYSNVLQKLRTQMQQTKLRK